MKIKDSLINYTYAIHCYINKKYLMSILKKKESSRTSEISIKP